MTRYTVTAERGQGDDMWVFQCVEAPGAISESTQLEDAGELMREAIGFVEDVAEGDVDVHLEVDFRQAV